ncbi:hypothetical protein K440DRAFT_605702 [Wilcoxina mikolae CBS 423.85]|nr:hypothetical protein K440DRAFT_605702 [Wilcoxina mikolae CBS 423.85]
MCSAESSDQATGDGGEPEAVSIDSVDCRDEVTGNKSEPEPAPADSSGPGDGSLTAADQNQKDNAQHLAQQEAERNADSNPIEAKKESTPREKTPFYFNLSKPVLVIGIDFGTRDTSVSWAIADRRREVHIIENWPDPQCRNRTSLEVPTAVTYNIHDPSKLISWGFPAIRRQGPRDGKESEPFTRFKLLLQESERMPEIESNSELGTLCRLMREHGKTVQDITVDYLRCIWSYTIEQLNAITNEDFQATDHMRVILTIPAVWTPNTTIMMKELAVKAGLPRSMDLLPELEAAAVAGLRDTAEKAELQKGDIITICHAGHITCEVITYKIHGMQPLIVKDYLWPEDDFCGSIYIDKAFETYIKTLVGPTQYNALRERDKIYMMTDFELGIKLLFQHNTQNQHHVIDLRGVRDDIPNGIHDESITLKQ